MPLLYYYCIASALFSMTLSPHTKAIAKTPEEIAPWMFIAANDDAYGASRNMHNNYHSLHLVR